MEIVPLYFYLQCFDIFFPSFHQGGIPTPQFSSNKPSIVFSSWQPLGITAALQGRSMINVLAAPLLATVGAVAFFLGRYGGQQAQPQPAQLAMVSVSGEAPEAEPASSTTTATADRFISSEQMENLGIITPSLHVAPFLHSPKLSSILMSKLYQFFNGFTQSTGATWFKTCTNPPPPPRW